ncbi:MAG: reverse transcriptase family protein, partial [Nitrosopumilus sp.]|nr:reverse transcriptase family protein [Nitrosopumilus sp.]
PHIIHPTRITSTTKTCIDKIFSNSANYDEGISGNLTVKLSDHLAQFLIIPEECDHTTKNHDIYIRDFKNYDRENFLLDLLATDWPSALKLHKNDPNLAFEGLQVTIDTLVDKYLPIRKMTKKEVKLKQKPWITNEILRLMKERDKLYKKFIKAKNEVIKASYHKKYKSLRNQIVTLCRLSKKDHYQRLFSDNSDNLRNTWRGIKSIISLNSTDKRQPTSILINDVISSDPTEIANGFNNYFSNIAGKLQKSLHVQDQDFNSYLQERSDHSFFIQPTDKFEIFNIINSNIGNKSCGPNSIPYHILHLIKFNIAQPLADIINLSFSTGKYIEKLKISKTVPIYKEKGDRLLCSNYRPISLLSNFKKIFEKLMHKRLYDFLEKQNSIFVKQFGFRKKHSTTHALTDLTEHIRQALDDNKFAAGIFIDLQKAFDTVDHKILLKKLDHYGVRGIANNWFQSYLSNRKQFVSIANTNSNIVNMEFGVPQGSVLGPLLFLIYINDLHSAIKYCTTRHFADDTNLLNVNDSLKQMRKHLNLDLRNLCNWLKANKISLNCSKTELIIFRHPNKPLLHNKHPFELKIKINGSIILPSKSVKYLGITLDPYLNWSCHTGNLASRLSRATGMLAKIRHFVSKNTLLNIYHGIFSSILTYGSHVWGQSINKHISRIQRIQNKAIRIINFAHFRDPVSPLYYTSKVPKFSDHIKIQNACYVHDSLNGNLPIALQDSFKLALDTHRHDTRGASQSKLMLPKARTQAYGINSIKYQSVAIWNIITCEIPDKKFLTLSKSTCKKLITNHILDKYNT